MPAPPDLSALQARRYDLVVVGGGIHGIMVLLEAARRGLRSLLLERGAFGAATTANSLRIIHGGLRYLQSLDLRRHRESVVERRWFLREFPGLVEPLRCLMPLYGRGLRRPWVFRTALTVNDLLALDRNAGVRLDRRLPAGRVVDADEVRRICPAVEPRGLLGGAIWYDAVAPDMSALVLEALRSARADGALALDYVEAVDLLSHGQRTTGVRAREVRSDLPLEFQADVVINAAGPWCAGLAAAWDRAYADLYPPSIAWNILFRREPLADGALAIDPPRAHGQTYFLLRSQDLLLAGTGHAPWCGQIDEPRPSAEQMARFIADLNAAVPGLALEETQVERVFAGLLPAAAPGSAELARRVRVVDHGRARGPAGLFTVSGIKLTTARAAAARVLRQAFPKRRRSSRPSRER